jgi:hypothetical protein
MLFFAQGPRAGQVQRPQDIIIIIIIIIISSSSKQQQQ